MKGQDLKREIMIKHNLKDSDIRKWNKKAKELWDSFQNERSLIMSEFDVKMIPLRNEVTDKEDKLVKKYMEKLCSNKTQRDSF